MAAGKLGSGLWGTRGGMRRGREGRHVGWLAGAVLGRAGSNRQGWAAWQCREGRRKETERGVFTLRFEDHVGCEMGAAAFSCPA